MDQSKSTRIYNNVPIFIISTYLISWAFWIIPMLSYFKIITTSLPLNILQLGGTFVPSILGIIFTFLAEGKSGLQEILNRTKSFHFSKWWWLYLVGIMPLILAISFAILKISGDQELKFFLGNPLYLIPLFFGVILIQFGPLGEEFGWRGFLQPRLMKKWNPTITSIILGIIWSIWHIPLFFIEGTIQNSLNLWEFAIFTILLTFLYTLLFLKTNGSIGAAILFHTMGNLSQSLFPVIFSPSGRLIMGIVMLISVLLLILKFRANFMPKQQKK